MFNLQSKKRSEYSAKDLADFNKMTADYWINSREFESQSVDDLEKHLWLANGAAATVSIGFIQAKHTVPIYQYAGTWIFVTGILLLVIMKFVSALNASRDRSRFQDAKSRFDAEEVTDQVFRNVRDKTFRVLKYSYLTLQWSSGIGFIAGCIFTLLGVKMSG